VATGVRLSARAEASGFSDRIEETALSIKYFYIKTNQD
jgi:hypothetical protein